MELQTLVEFVAVAEENVIDDFDSYMVEFQDYLIKYGIIDRRDIDRQYYSLTKIALYSIDFLFEDSDWKITVEFSTYERSYELEVSIQSANYAISLENNSLEHLKVIVKNFIKTKHKGIFWLYDAESEFLATDLYPKIFKVENLARKFITTVMNRKFGIHWWQLVPIELQNKHKSRVRKYKSIIDNFRDVDERLMSIDTGDLIKILSTKVMKWDSSDENTKELETPNLSVENLVKILQNQQVVDMDWWQTVFLPFLHDGFLEDFKEFESNRNHIAHNKLIDRTAYQSILESINVIEVALSNGLKKVSSVVLSEERQEEEFVSELFLSERIRELKESESGVTTRGESQILNLFNDELNQLYYSIVEDFRFSAHLEFSDYFPLQDKVSSGTVFEIKNKVDGELISFEADTDINDHDGEESYLILSYMKSSNPTLETLGSISYTNGETEFDDLQGIYMPVQMDGISESDLSKIGNLIVKVVNDEFINYKDIVNSSKYSRIKDGGMDPILDLACQECYEEWICIDEDIIDIGICLNCGEMNEIAECERCGRYDFGSPSDDEPFLCDDCLNYYGME
ncbi:hypothetical protein [Streptococcus suis]|uniref:hypothetical protein n=1 Tax=Streptococcus suis TaxID=1307 RepID=UPI000420858C|nr:hypothetical protein [Streptococcus suis]HEM3180945.1 hypothetical protein [Streptococcus suis 89-5259]